MCVSRVGLDKRHTNLSVSVAVDNRGIFFFFRLSKQQWFIRNALVDMSLTASVANLLAVAVERHQTIITMQVKRLTTLTDSKAFSFGFKLVWLFF